MPIKPELRDLEAAPSELATVNWGLEHIERLRRGRAETRQSIVALTTGIGGVAIGAMVALTGVAWEFLQDCTLRPHGMRPG